jgi:16S rRNA processing protein RimM
MNYFKVGTIVNTQGLQGEVRVISVTDFADERYKPGKKLALFDPKDHFVKDLVVKTHRKQKNFDILKFVDHYHINDVEKYKNYVLKVAEEDLQDLEEEEFYFHQIIGLEVFENGEKIGVVKEIMQPGANDVWVVARPGKKDLLLPYIPPVILNVDIANNRVDVDVMEGLDD